MESGAFRLTLVADTSERFHDFRPYVASIDDEGVVAFQAEIAGATGIFTGSGGPVTAVATSRDGLVRRFRSHPDIDARKWLSVYADLVDGREAVLIARDGRLLPIAQTGERFTHVGPLGPTMNDQGAVAFRATTREGLQTIFVGDEDGISPVDDLPPPRELQGLPVVCADRCVVFRGDDAIYASHRNARTTIAKISSGYSALGAFPSADNHGTVVFSAVLDDGLAGIFSVDHGARTMVVGGNARFESFRGAVVNDAGTVVFYATPIGGQLGVYAARSTEIVPIVSVGDALFGSHVVELALNPVSINDADQVAIRLVLANGTQAIVRADPR